MKKPKTICKGGIYCHMENDQLILTFPQGFRAKQLAKWKKTHLKEALKMLQSDKPCDNSPKAILTTIRNVHRVEIQLYNKVEPVMFWSKPDQSEQAFIDSIKSHCKYFGVTKVICKNKILTFN
jgi:hypothetical protein